MQKRKKLLAPTPTFGDRYQLLYESLSHAPSSRAAEMLGHLVEKAKSYFEAGKDPDKVYSDFDVDSLADTLMLDRNAAARALEKYKDKDQLEMFSACMFVSSAIITVNSSDPHLSRLILGCILKKGKEDPEYSYLSKVVLIVIADVVNSMPDSEPIDPSLTSLAMGCMRRLAKS